MADRQTAGPFLGREAAPSPRRPQGLRRKVQIAVCLALLPSKFSAPPKRVWLLAQNLLAP